MSFFKHQNALVETENIGSRTRIWAFAHILPGAQIGEDCNICDHTFIENDVIVGNRVTIKCGVQLWDGIRIEDDVFVGPNVTFTNDKFPRSRRYPGKFLPTVVHKCASIGAGATILPGISVGANAMVGAGTVVTRDVPANAIVVGNPARITGYVGTERKCSLFEFDNRTSEMGPTCTGVRGVVLYRLPKVKDLRGSLSCAEVERQVPFPVKRVFMVFEVENEQIRGEHAHRTLHQFLICVAGKCHVVADDGINREEYALNQPELGLYLPPMTWGVQYKYSKDAVLLVLASDLYDPGS